MKINYKIWVLAVILIEDYPGKKKGWIGGNINTIEVEIGPTTHGVETVTQRKD